MRQVSAIEEDQKSDFRPSVCATNPMELTSQLFDRERQLKMGEIAYNIHVCATILSHCVKDVSFTHVV